VTALPVEKVAGAIPGVRSLVGKLNIGAASSSIGAKLWNSSRFGPNSALFGNVTQGIKGVPQLGGAVNKIGSALRIGWRTGNGYNYFGISSAKITVNNGHFWLFKGPSFR
jgi:hypothetical protein